MAHQGVTLKSILEPTLIDQATRDELKAIHTYCHEANPNHAKYPNYYATQRLFANTRSFSRLFRMATVDPLVMSLAGCAHIEISGAWRALIEERQGVVTYPNWNQDKGLTFQLWMANYARVLYHTWHDSTFEDMAYQDRYTHYLEWRQKAESLDLKTPLGWQQAKFVPQTNIEHAYLLLDIACELGDFHALRELAKLYKAALLHPTGVELTEAHMCNIIEHCNNLILNHGAPGLLLAADIYTAISVYIDNAPDQRQHLSPLQPRQLDALAIDCVQRAGEFHLSNQKFSSYTMEKTYPNSDNKGWGYPLSYGMFSKLETIGSPDSPDTWKSIKSYLKNHLNITDHELEFACRYHKNLINPTPAQTKAPSSPQQTIKAY